MPADAGFQPSTVCNDLTYVLDAMAEYVNTVGQHLSDVLYNFTQPDEKTSFRAERSPPKWRRKSHRSKPFFGELVPSKKMPLSGC